MPARKAGRPTHTQPKTEGIAGIQGVLDRSVTRRVFDSVVADVSVVIDEFTRSRVSQDELVAFLRDRLEALSHLQEDGTVSKMLEHAETALVEAVMASPDVVNFEAARRDFAAENPDARGPESDSGTGFAIS